jgi:hypothetical protein
MCVAKLLRMCVAKLLRSGRLFSSDGEAAMTTLQFLALGMIVAWTPCFITFAVLMWRAPDFDEADTPQNREAAREKRAKKAAASLV